MNLSLKNSPYFKASKAPRQMSENVPYCPTYSKNNANKGLMENPDGLVHELFPQLCELSPLQLQALELRLRGWPIGKIAQKLSLDRKTISRWCNHHPGFVAEFNRRQEEMVRQSALMHRRLLRKLQSPGRSPGQ